MDRDKQRIWRFGTERVLEIPAAPFWPRNHSDEIFYQKGPSPSSSGLYFIQPNIRLFHSDFGRIHQKKNTDSAHAPKIETADHEIRPNCATRPSHSTVSECQRNPAKGESALR
jgi:hypothetical protein